MEVLVAALVFEGEMSPLPHVGVAAAAVELCRPPLEAETLAGRVRLGRRRVAGQAAQAEEVLLRGRALLQLDQPPFGDEFRGCHVLSQA
jgi:hypothetical protein